MFTSKGSRQPRKNAQLVVRQLTLVRRNERLSGTPMDEQVETAFVSLVRKGVMMNDEVFEEAGRRIHESHRRTITRTAVVERANQRADSILSRLKQMLVGDD